MLSASIKLELINRLVAAGCRTVEAGAFVSPKWVPQMADTESILRKLCPQEGISYPVLIPNVKGLEKLLALSTSCGSVQDLPSREIAIFTAATESFTRANTNCSVQESLRRCGEVTVRALELGLSVRGYVSVIAVCPFEGRVKSEQVACIARELLDMGCYEVSLGDTTGAGTPEQMLDVIEACEQVGVPASRLAGHCHNTFGIALANVLALSQAGVRTFDASVASLGGCPYSPGATGNVDTESLVYAFHAQGYATGIDLVALAHIGQWISNTLGRPNGSLAGRAILSREKATTSSVL